MWLLRRAPPCDGAAPRPSLKPTECVHHFNHNRTDNRIENLELMDSWAEHQRRHGYYEPENVRTAALSL